MDKSILIIDTPKSCADCPILLSRPKLNCGEYDWKNNIHNRVKFVCPLKPMPERFETTILTEYCLGNADGWNACIDAIEGET